MRIIKIGALASDLEAAYDGLKRALRHLGRGNTAKTKNEIKKAIKSLERVRPHLKYKDRPVRRRY